jgi:hypothetical protein
MYINEYTLVYYSLQIDRDFTRRCRMFNTKFSLEETTGMPVVLRKDFPRTTVKVRGCPLSFRVCLTLISSAKLKL